MHQHDFTRRPVGRIGQRSGRLVAMFIAGLALLAVLPMLSTVEAADGGGRSDRSEGSLSETSTKVADWIAKLGDESYLVREAATQRLLDAGHIAQGPLATAAEDPHPEIRARARRLLVLIEQDQFQQRLDAFAADLDGRRGLTMPGWEKFQTIVGGDATSRALFVEMQRNESALLRIAFADESSDLESHLAERVSRLLGQQQHVSRFQIQNNRSDAVPPLGSCAAVFFVGTAVEPDHAERLAPSLGQLAQRAPLRAAATSGTYRPQVRRLFSHWILDDAVNSPKLVAQRLSLLALYQLEEALPFAKEVAQGAGPWEGLHPNIRGQAILILGQLAGEQQALETLEPLLEDATVCRTTARRNAPGGPAEKFTVQIRDVALAVLVRQTGQEMAAYGFRAERHEHMLFKLPSLGFQSDSARLDALGKWQSWRDDASVQSGG